jgi:hypothetical protein
MSSLTRDRVSECDLGLLLTAGVVVVEEKAAAIRFASRRTPNHLVLPATTTKATHVARIVTKARGCAWGKSIRQRYPGRFGLG